MAPTMATTAGGLPFRRSPVDPGSDGLPQPSRTPSVADGEWTLGRLSRLQGRMTAADTEESTIEVEPIEPMTSSDGVESGRLAGRAAGLIPTAGLAGEPLLPQRPQRPGVPPARLDEILISARVRELVERPISTPQRPPVGEPLLDETSSEVIDRADALPRRR